uniref:Uncharacterized protein n=1 Tax=Meloidogyne enterolobii TaxID=390850 RepID=A0A6V7ULF7_MELEN|nr:unnamed protein product [Meloidogyne enterolobii]
MLLKTWLERLFDNFMNYFKKIFLTCHWLDVPGRDRQTLAPFGCESLEGKASAMVIYFF